MGPAVTIKRWAGRGGRALLAALALAGCGSAPRETFDLKGPDPAVASRAASQGRRAALAVNEPQATPLANSDRIAVRTGPQEVAYLAEAQWADRLPRLAQARIVAGFEHGRVAAAFPGAVVDFVLATEIRRFEIDVTRGMAVVEIAARLLDDRSNRQRAAQVFVGEAPAPHTTGPQAAQALEEALDSVIVQMRSWAAGRM